MQPLTRHQQEPATPLFNKEKVTKSRWHTRRARKPAHCWRARACQTSLWPSSCCAYTYACRISLFHNCEDANTQRLMIHTDCHQPKKQEGEKKNQTLTIQERLAAKSNLVMEDVNGSVRLWPQQDFGAHLFTSHTLSAQPKRRSRAHDLKQKPFSTDIEEALGTQVTTPFCVTDFLSAVITRFRHTATEVAHSSRARRVSLQATNYKKQTTK